MMLLLGIVVHVWTVVMLLLGIVVHVWTVVIAYEASGVAAAVLALIMPILAQIYWFFDVMSASGTIVNVYCLSVLAFFALLGVFSLGSVVLIKLSEKFEREDG